MITKFDVMNTRGTQITFELENVSSGFVVYPIDGMGPVKATIVTSSFAGLDGTQYQSSHREMRNITFKFGLEPYDPLTSVEHLRATLYKYFMPKSAIGMKFYTSEGLEVYISGIVESCDPDIFTAEPTMVVSVLCFDPDFFDPIPIGINGMTTAEETEMLVTYDGTVESGIKFRLLLDRTVSEFSIYHRTPDGSLSILEFDASMVSGDVLTINTVPGNKYATIRRAGSDTSVVYGVASFSRWIELQPGDNQIRVYATGAPVAFDIEYTNKYGGL